MDQKWKGGEFKIPSPLTTTERVIVCINTKDRLEYLLITLSSLLCQTLQTWDLIIMDASKEPVINDERVMRLFAVIRKYGHEVKYETDLEIGIPHSYQKMTEMATNEFVVRQEDDIWMEPEMLERALEVIQTYPTVGAVGFMTPHWGHVAVHQPPVELKNGFRKVDHSSLCPLLPFIWEATDEQGIVCKEDKIWSVCTIHGGSMFRKKAWEACQGFCVHLSPTGHREETLFYLRMYMARWDLAVRSTSRLWHFESTFGGSRPSGAQSQARQQNRIADESKFQGEFSALVEVHKGRPVYFL